MRFAGSYAIIVGLLILIQWMFFLVTGSVPELRTEPIRITFHLVAEFATAVLLITGGIASLKSKPSAKSLLFVAFGMLLYTAIVSPGYFAQNGRWGFILMFGVIVVLTLISIRQLNQTGKS